MAKALFPEWLRKESGAVLLTVIMLTIVLSVMALGIMGANLTHLRSSQSVVDQIKAEQIALGTFYRFQQIRNEDCESCPTPFNCASCTFPAETLNGKVFQPTVTDRGDTAGSPGDTSEIVIDVSYN